MSTAQHLNELITKRDGFTRMLARMEHQRGHDKEVTRTALRQALRDVNYQIEQAQRHG
jgi:hypothetical protein